MGMAKKVTKATNVVKPASKAVVAAGAKRKNASTLETSGIPESAPVTDYPPHINSATLWKAIESTRSAFIVTDHNANDEPIVYANQAFLDLTGYSMPEVMGHNCRFLQGSGTSKSSIAKLRQAVKDGQHIQIRIKNYRKDGSAFWNDLIMSPVVDDEGKTTHFVGFQLDVTDQVSFEERLRQSSRRLAQSNQELEQFTYAASHDLQEPLRMVASYLQLIKERYHNKLDDDADVFIGFATEGAQRMQALVNDLLALSRVRTAGRELKLEDMNKILDVVIANMQLAIQESRAEITTDTLPKLEVDRTQMTQLLQNLISNAIKYRHRDRPPVIHISVEKRRKCYRFAIQDNGIGIEADYLERIFGMFQRLHTRSEYPGTGVGLAICSKIIERHGGKIWAESRLNQQATATAGRTPGDAADQAGLSGTTFYFELPIRQMIT